MSKPLITVAMPVFNAGKYLRPALLSIINQTYTNWELVIIDDGSSDGCLDNLSELKDSRIKVLRDGKNKGIAPRLNEIIGLAKGEFIARMDNDDIAHPQRFELQLAKLQSQQELDLVSTRAFTIDKNSEVVGELPFNLTHQAICAKPWLGFYMAHPTWMGRADWFKKHLYADPNPYFCEDQELLLRSFAKSQFATVNQVLLSYRVANSINFKKLVKTRVALLKYQFKYFNAHRQYFFLSLAIIVFICRIVKAVLLKLSSLNKGS